LIELEYFLLHGIVLFPGAVLHGNDALLDREKLAEVRQKVVV
tara:strand:+ start:474 stop:599 length:126 start_codon:yes stop_codon:yes gene_type:complete